MADVTKEQVVDFLSKMSVLDLAGLTKELEDKWGVKAAPVAVAAAPGAAAGGAAAPAAEQTEFTVTLLEAGGDKNGVIKGGPPGDKPRRQEVQEPLRRRAHDA